MKESMRQETRRRRRIKIVLDEKVYLRKINTQKEEEKNNLIYRTVVEKLY